jgi:hypothetical protein
MDWCMYQESPSSLVGEGGPMHPHAACFTLPLASNFLLPIASQLWLADTPAN